MGMVKIAPDRRAKLKGQSHRAETVRPSKHGNRFGAYRLNVRTDCLAFARKSAHLPLALG
jgi:hypothetical protein